MTTAEAERRVRALKHWEQYGLEAAMHAFQASRSTLYRWRKRLRDAGSIVALNPRSRAPRGRRRRWNWPQPLRERIEYVRRCEVINAGKDKVHELLQPWCEEHGYPTPSASTIGRLIFEHPKRMRVHSPKHLDSRGRVRQKRRRERNIRPNVLLAERCGQVVGVDTVEFFYGGRRRYLLTCIDHCSRFAFAVATNSHTSATAALFLEHVLQVFPGKLEAVLSDNGSEFQGAFDRLLTERGIEHYVTRPKTPKMNAHAERFNRTVQEEFADFEEELLFTDLPRFNEKLLEWLLRYNARRPHHSLGYLSPLKFLIQEREAAPPKDPPESHMSWTYSIHLIIRLSSYNTKRNIPLA